MYMVQDDSQELQTIPGDHRLPRHLDGAVDGGAGLWESTSAWVFWPANSILASRAHFVRAFASCCAVLLATSIVLPAHRVAVPSAYMNAVVPGTSCRAAARVADPSRNEDTALGQTRPVDASTANGNVDLHKHSSVFQKPSDLRCVAHGNSEI